MKKITLSFLMVFSFAYSFSQIVSCFNATPICGNNVVISNSTNIASPGAVSCLSTTPNPTWFIFKTGTAGDYEFQLSQGDNAPTYNNQDLDYALWGPFTDLPDCSVELYDYPTGNTAINNNLISCSYSASPTENFSLSNAQAGKFYVVLSTNYSNMAGSILLQQTNLGTTGAGTLICDYVIVNLQPENSTFTTNGNVSFSVASTNALTYKWEMSTDLTDWTILNDGGTIPQISGSDTNTLSLNNIPSSFSGNYFRVLISNTNDNIYSKVAQLSQTLSNSNFSLDFADAFYDRNGSIIIEKNATAGDIKFRLIDINGRVLKSSQFSNDKFIVSVGSLDNGVYFLELKSEDKSGIKKLLID